METVTGFIFLGSKITADGDCSYEIKRHLLLGRKAMTNLGSILKSRDVAMLTNVHTVKAVVFPGVTCGSESWTIKKAEFQASFFTLFFHFHQEALYFLFAFCHKVVSSVYLRLLKFLLVILILACASSNLAFHMTYWAYKLCRSYVK